MLTRETVQKLIGSDPTMAAATLTLAIAEMEETPEELVELGVLLRCFGEVLAGNDAVDVPSSITNFIKGVNAQLRTAIAVAR